MEQRAKSSVVAADDERSSHNSAVRTAAPNPANRPQTHKSSAPANHVQSKQTNTTRLSSSFTHRLAPAPPVRVVRSQSGRQPCSPLIEMLRIRGASPAAADNSEESRLIQLKMELMRVVGCRALFDSSCSQKCCDTISDITLQF